MQVGAQWLMSGKSSTLFVASVIVPEELVTPIYTLHPAVGTMTAKAIDCLSTINCFGCCVRKRLTNNMKSDLSKKSQISWHEHEKSQFS